MRKLIFMFVFLISSVFTMSMIVPSALAETEGSSNSIEVSPIQGPTVARQLVGRAKTSWVWYVTRASGLVAAVSLVILILSGIGQITGHTFKFLEPLTAWASHRALGIVFSISLVAHILGVVVDKFVPFSIWQVLVPWLSDYKPVTVFGIHLGSLYIAFGVLSFYGTVLIMLTSLVWIEKKPYLWKISHLLSYLVMFFVFIHALYLGTDLVHGVLRWLWIVSGVFIVYASIARLWRAKTT